MSGDAPQEVRILLVEDNDADAELVSLRLRRAGLPCVFRRVQTEIALREAFTEFSPTLVLSDFRLPQFDGLSALRIAQEVAPDVPFIFVSGTIGEEVAIDALRRGAIDYVLKNNAARLVPAVRRALSDAQMRAERRLEQARIARLDRVLRMLSGANALIVRVRDRKELLREICRLAVAVGGYTTAIGYYKLPGAPGLQVVGGSGENQATTDSLGAALLRADESAQSFVERVVRTDKPFVLTEATAATLSAEVTSLVHEVGLRSLVALPITVDNTAMGALVLTAHEAGAVSEDELQMLLEVAGNVSYAMQYLQKDVTVRFLSHFDPQTGLAKRSLFRERLARMMEQAAARRSRLVVAVIDIERLSLINDSFGRRTGDLLLQHVADRLKRRFPQTEQIAHFGGGTFAVVRDPGNRSMEETQAAAREHGAALFGEPFVIEQREIPVSGRSGFTIFPEQGKDANALIQQAEAALLSARATGQRRVYYSAKAQSQLVSGLALEHRLRVALERQQFELHYQPKVNVKSRRIEGAEALIRWRDPDRGLISPGEFLPVLESTGLIVEVGAWVIRRAALDCQRWLVAGLPPIRIAVNVSPSQLRLSDFVEGFSKSLGPWSSPAAGLDIEITEGSLHEDLAAEVARLKLLRASGVRIAIDDFGTGYSSLGRLAKLPVDTLKIDRSFISQVPQDPVGRKLVLTMINLARAFNLTTVAEGVENQDQLDFVWHVGCDQSQGYLHSPALPADEFAHLLEHGRGKLVRAPEPAAAAERSYPDASAADGAEKGR
jgi:diguanylate cyclase (GGDEF)-like protein